MDAGDSWERVGEDVVKDPVMAVAVSAAERSGEHGVVYAGTEPSAVYRSEDGGETWRELGGMREVPSAPEWSFPPRPETHHVRWISPDPNISGRLFVAIEAGALIQTPDGGETWEDRTPDGPLDTHTLATHKDAPGRTLLGGGRRVHGRGIWIRRERRCGRDLAAHKRGPPTHYLWE
jgi:hypothetical protein